MTKKECVALSVRAFAPRSTVGLLAWSLLQELCKRIITKGISVRCARKLLALFREEGNSGFAILTLSSWRQ